jgi:hypothetical protein
MSRLIRVSRRVGLAALLGALILPSIAPGVASAHEHRHVGEFELTVGFSIEPAYEGLKNGVFLRVVRGEGDEATPVEGLEATLEVEVSHVETAVTQTFALRSLFNEPGSYTADLLPTAAGQYQFRFTGDLDGTPLDETFTSGEGTFNSVESSAALQFPQALPEVRELQAAVTGAQDAAFEADDAASAARTLALAGLATGVVGAVAGLGGIVVATRRK